jgi:hypothetical protein
MAVIGVPDKTPQVIAAPTKPTAIVGTGKLKPIVVSGAPLRGPQGVAGPAGQSPWGGITGTLANQTDLVAALNSKATSAQGAKADSAVQPGDLATVATSGNYNDLIGSPTLGTVAATDTTAYATAAQGVLADTAVQPAALATVATSGSYTHLSDKPTIPTTAAEVGAATAAQGTKADTAIQPSEKGAANGVATLDAGAKIPLAQLPASATTETSEVTTEVAMLALTAQAGDVAIRTDISTSFILQATPASTLSNWKALLSPTSGGGAAVGSDVPQNLGVATPGISTSASRQDHVHTLPTAADIGVEAGATANPDTDSLVEGTTNLYFTPARISGLLPRGLVEDVDTSFNSGMNSPALSYLVQQYLPSQAPDQAVRFTSIRRYEYESAFNNSGTGRHVAGLDWYVQQGTGNPHLAVAHTATLDNEAAATITTAVGSEARLDSNTGTIPNFVGYRAKITSNAGIVGTFTGHQVQVTNNTGTLTSLVGYEFPDLSSLLPSTDRVAYSNLDPLAPILSVAPIIDQSIAYASPSISGFIVTVPACKQILLLTPVEDYSAGTIVFPAQTTLYDGQTLEIFCTKTLSGVAWDANGAAFIYSPPTEINPSRPLRFRYYQANDWWMADADYDLTNTVLSILGASPGTVVQSNTADSTTGRLLMVGAFGLGASLLTAEVDCNAVTTPGTYGTPSTLMTNAPPGFLGRMLLSFQGDTNYGYQVAIDSNNLTSPKLAYRSIRVGVWYPWQTAWTNETLVKQTTTTDTTAGALLVVGAQRAALGVDVAWSSTITEATTARTLSLAGASGYIRFTNATASTCTVAPQATVAWAADTEIGIRRAAVGNLTLAPGAGVTLNAPSGGTLVMTDRMSVTLKRVAVDVWDVIGQTVAV